MQPSQNDRSSSTSPDISFATVATSDHAQPLPVQRVANVVKHPSTIASLPSTSQATNIVADHPRAVAFTVERPVVSENLLRSLKNPANRKSFDPQYTHFLYTSWFPAGEYTTCLVTKQNEAILHANRSDHDNALVEHYNALVEVLLYNTLKSRAMFLIHSFVEVGKLTLTIGSMSSCEAVSSRRTRTRTISKINKHYQETFDILCDHHKKYGSKIDHQKTADAIITIKERIKLIRGHIEHYRRMSTNYVLISANLEYINSMLDILTVDKEIEPKVVINLANKYVHNIGPPALKKRAKRLIKGRVPKVSRLKPIPIAPKLPVPQLITHLVPVQIVPKAMTEPPKKKMHAEFSQPSLIALDEEELSCDNLEFYLQLLKGTSEQARMEVEEDSEFKSILKSLKEIDPSNPLPDYMTQTGSNLPCVTEQLQISTPEPLSLQGRLQFISSPSAQLPISPSAIRFDPPPSISHSILSEEKGFLEGSESSLDELFDFISNVEQVTTQPSMLVEEHNMDESELLGLFD